MSEKFEVVVSGISGRFPEADDVDTFKKNLYNSENFITENNKKWPLGYSFNLGKSIIPDGTGKYTNVQFCDYKCFVSSKSFAESQDIINRKVMEPSIEAIIDAGINPYSLGGENIGVYMCAAINEYEEKIGRNNPLFDKIIVGASKTMQANRISFALNLQGPSSAFLTDPFGSFDALRTAYEAISKGYISGAIVGVGSNILDPKLSLHFLFMKYLSGDGLCRAFDKRANGYGRSESIVVLFLQRAEDAKRSYGSIVFCDTYYLGSRNSAILRIDEVDLKNSLEYIYAKNNFMDTVSELTFMEMNAPGIKNFDRIESEAIADICQKTKKPLLVGSVKSNVGHTEAAAPYMSLLKALFALDSGLIAPNLNFNIVNDEISAIKNKLIQVVNSLTPLEGDLVAVNALGMFGSVNHVAVKCNSRKQTNQILDDIPRLILICGRTEDGLRSVIERIEKIPFNAEFVALMNEAFGTNMPQHLYRGYTVVNQSTQPLGNVEIKGHHGRPIWFVFSGMGSQWNCCGKGLLEIPPFADAIRRCDAVLGPLGVDIFNIITSDDPTIFDDILNAFVAVNSVQIGLTEILKAIGIEPDGIIGHSAGEIACGYADGCLTLEQSIMASYERGYVSKSIKTIKGMMAAVGKGYNEIKDSLPKDIYVACHNARDSSTLSGPAEEICKLVEQLTSEGVFARSVNVANIAFHSPYISSLGPSINTRLQQVIPQPKQRSSKWISTSFPENEWNKPMAKYCSADYFTNNLLNPVLFEEGSKLIPENAIVIEIAPHGLLQAILKRSLPSTCTNISLTMRSKNKENLNFLLGALGRIYIAGGEPQVNNLFPKVSFPVPRNTPSLSPYCNWFLENTDPSGKMCIASPAIPLSAEKIEIIINHGCAFSFLKDHKIQNDIVIPPSLYMHLTWWIFSLKRNEKLDSVPVIFEDVTVHKNLNISMIKSRTFKIMIQGSGAFEVIVKNKDIPQEPCVVASGKIIRFDANTHINVEENADYYSGISTNKTEFYEAFQKIGYNLSNDFASVEDLVTSGTDCCGKIRWTENWVAFLDSAMKFQMFSNVKKNRNFIYPTFIRRMVLNVEQMKNIKKGKKLFCHYDTTRNKFQTLGIEIDGIECKMEHLNSSSEVKLEAFRFIAFENPKCQSVNEFIDFCLQIAVENILISSIAGIPKLHVSCCPEASAFSRDVKKILENNYLLKYYVKNCKNFEIQAENISWLLISTTSNWYHSIKLKPKNLFILTITSLNDYKNNLPMDFTLITKQTFGKVVFSLLQKKSTEQGSIFCKIDDVNNKKSKFIVKRKIESADLTEIISPKKSCEMDKLLFILDDGDNGQNGNKYKFMEKNLQNFSHIVVKNGEFGSYKRVSKWENNFKNLIEFPSIQLYAFCVDDLELHSRISLQDQEENDISIEFSGIDRSGKKVMGIATMESNGRNSKIDPFLVWNVPSEWTFEEAATVPNLYTLAHFIYMVSSNWDLSSSVLINVGKEILLSQICIRLFLQKKYHVFVTISDNDMNLEFFRKFLQSEKICILIESECQYERQLMHLTNGKGVNVVVNCLSGAEHVIASFNCASHFSTIFDIHTSNQKEIEEIGLNPFLKSISFHLISSSSSYVSKLHPSDKEKLQKYVQQGISSGFVTPLAKTTSSTENPIEIRPTRSTKHVIKFIPDHEHIQRNIENWKLDDEHCCLIIGDSSKHEWHSLVLWLKDKGCQKYVVSVENAEDRIELLTRLENESDGAKFVSSYFVRKELDCVESTKQVLNAIQSIAPLGAMFFVSMESAEQNIRNLDLASQYYNLHIPLVSLYSGGLSELELRRNKGFPAYLLHGANSDKFSDVLNALDEFVTACNPQMSPPILFHVMEDYAKFGMKSPVLRLGDYLPKDLRELENFGMCIGKKNTFYEQTSLSLPYAQTKGVCPIFVLPTIKGSHLETLLKNLYYPVFCATFAGFEYTLCEQAKKLFEELNNIQPSEPVTLISETWNVGLALEISHLLKSAKRKYRIFLLEGYPDEWLEYINSFGAPHLPDFDNCLLKEIFDLDSLLDVSVWHADTLDEKIRCYLNKTEYKNLNLDSISKAINVIQYQLCLASQKEVKNEILENVTLLVRQHSNYYDIKLSVTSNIVITNDINYEKFLQNPQLRSVINENAAYQLANVE